MNPPSALAGAMNRERKPFTYTPGGLDLSEIKSERMAKRLMRNAMNQGVAETPVQAVQSPPPNAVPVALPNYNCLPVQVFPTFNLPANPKTLLRTRSYPDPNERNEKVLKKPDKSLLNEPNTHSVLNKVIGNNNNIQKIDDSNKANNYYTTPINYGSGGHTLSNMNSIKEFDSNAYELHKGITETNVDFDSKDLYENIRPDYLNNTPITLPNVQTDCASKLATNIAFPIEEKELSENKKEEVVVTKEKRKENLSSNQNGDSEAAVTVKLPSKKSEAKTETKVEVVKKILPDGSVQEIKTTITKTTIDGRTEIKTETETTTYPKESEEEEVEYEEEEEAEEVEIEESVKPDQVSEIVEKTTEKQESKAVEEINGKNETSDDAESEKAEESVVQNGQLIMQEEKHESSTTKKIVIQAETQDFEDENEENSEDVKVEEVIVLKKVNVNSSVEEKENIEVEVEENNVEEENNEEQENNEEVLPSADDTNATLKQAVDKDEEGEEPEVVVSQETEKEEEELEDEEEEVSEKYEDVETTETEKVSQEQESEKVEEEEEYEEVEDVDESEEVEKKEAVKETTPPPKEDDVTETEVVKDEEEKSVPQEQEVPIKVVIESEPEVKQTEEQPLPSSIINSLREPSVPLDKVEEVEIKPIGPAKEIITKTHTEIITKTTDKPVGTHSTQTEYNVVENIVTVNRTTKTLDHAYEEIPDNVHTIPTFVPSNVDRNLVSPQPVYKPYQPNFTPEVQPERRHSLLLDRISMDRQMPSDLYQNTYQNTQTFEDRQWSQEPQSEVLTVSNVKPSTITKNQQWYQRNEMETSYPSSTPATDSYSNQQNHSQFKTQFLSQTAYQSKPSQSFSQPIYQPQPQPQQPSPQPVYQAPPQQNPTLYHSKPSTQPIYSQSYTQPTSHSIYSSQTNTQSTYQSRSPMPTVQSIYQSEPQYQSKHLESSTFKSNTNNYQSSEPTYTPKPIWTSQTIESQPITNLDTNQYSYLSKDLSETIQKSTQQYSSSYVPPPWEQDPNYVPSNTTQQYYQSALPKPTITPSKEWKPPKPVSKFSKSTPTSYVPPAPNQSFVKPVNTVEPPKQPGRKTYYSEYERRYISVPETTYIPNETKYQPQPDPSPQYYYDNYEPAEVVEPQWRKELREFKEQSKTTIQTEQTSVRPPWEDDPKYATPKDFTPTPTWTQTLKPRSWRERSYEPEYVGSQEWPKTNTLGRGRPQSSYIKGNIDRVPDRTRGVSVDRYNPNNYQSPLTKEHPPPASHILDPIVQGKVYHNPDVPAYHSRASAEPREQPVTYQQPRHIHRESRATPVQSRSFKYLQWITGTED